MQKYLMVRIADLQPREKIETPPGDARVWDALRQTVGPITCESSIGIYFGTDEKAPMPTDQQLESWLCFAGLQKFSVMRADSLFLQIRRLGREPDPLTTLLRERLEQEGFKTKFQIWVARQFEFDDSTPLRTALQTLFSLGARSGVFHPAYEEARMVGLGDSFDWEDPHAKVESMAEAYQQAHAKGIWAALRKSYKFQELRPRTALEVRSVQDPLATLIQNANPESSRGLEGHMAPLTFLAALPNSQDSHSNAGHLFQEIQKSAAFYDRAVGAVYLRDNALPVMSIDVFSPLPMNHKTLVLSPGPEYGLFMIGPWDARNAIVERRVESWVCQEGQDALGYGELVDGEQDLILYFTRIIVRENGWEVPSTEAKELIHRNAARSLAQKAWLFWSSEKPETLLLSAKNAEVPLLFLGRQTNTGKCMFTKTGGKDPDTLRMSLLRAEPREAETIGWSYPEIKSPTYGYDKAAIFPDQFLLKVSWRSRREREWARKAHLAHSGDRMRTVTSRRIEASSLPYFRWTDGSETWGESLGTKEGWLDVDPRLAGVAAVDLAIRGLLCLGAQPQGGVANIWTSYPALAEGDDKTAENAQLWGSYLLGLEGAASMLRHFEFETTTVDGRGMSFPKAHSEIFVKLRNSVAAKMDAPFPGFRMGGEVLYAVGPKPAFIDAGSRILSHVRVVSNHCFKLNHYTQMEFYGIIYGLIQQGKISCIRPVGEGGVVQTLGEMSLWSGIGAQIRPNHPLIELFSAAPGRFVMGVLPNDTKMVENALRGEWLTLLGTTGGEKLMGLTMSRFYEERARRDDG